MASGLIVVQQYERMVVQRLGQFVGLQRPGLRFLIPVLYNGTKIDLREQVDRVPTQKYMVENETRGPFGAAVNGDDAAGQAHGF